MSLRQRTAPCSCRKLKYDGKKLAWSAVMFVVLSGRSRDNSRSPLTVLVRWVAYKGGLCFNASRRVARLAGAPSFHVNRPLIWTKSGHACRSTSAKFGHYFAFRKVFLPSSWMKLYSYWTSCPASFIWLPLFVNFRNKQWTTTRWFLHI